jgi:hypothetical protein
MMRAGGKGKWAAHTSEQLPCARLPLVPCEQPQARLDDLALGLEAGGCHRLGEERIVDLDVGSHRDLVEV